MMILQLLYVVITMLLLGWNRLLHNHISNDFIKMCEDLTDMFPNHFKKDKHKFSQHSLASGYLKVLNNDSRYVCLIAVEID